MNNKMDKKITIVTGASSGLGKDIAMLLCKKGHVVYSVARSKDKLLELQKDCEQEAGKIKVIVGDITDKKIREKLINLVLKNEGKIDYLINNAGYGKLGSHEDIEFEDLSGMYELNCIAGQHLCQLVIPSMKKMKRGRIINIASVAAFEPPPYFAVYNATKYATYGFSRSLSYDLHKTGVSVSAVFPSRMKTPFWAIAFKCKGLNKDEQNMCVEEWNKKSVGSLPVAEYIVRKIDSKRLILLPTLLSKVAFNFLRHFYFIGTFFMKTKGLKDAKKAIDHGREVK